MDDVSFELAPVVELIAELRWGPPGITLGADGSQSLTLSMGRETEEFFLRFGAAVAGFGYTQAEKLVPPGFPAILHQVVWRFRKPGDASSLLQVGLGLFSANALQPYRRWRDFRPTVVAGVNALLATRIGQEREQQFSQVSLRYMNAFSEPLLAGKSPAEFMRDVLCLKLELPEAIAKLVGPAANVSSTSNVLLPVANTSKVMSAAFGDGSVNSAPAAIYDVTLADNNVAGVADDVMAALDGSRDIIHSCFVELSKPIQSLMKPLGVDRAS